MKIDARDKTMRKHLWAAFNLAYETNINRWFKNNTVTQLYSTLVWNTVLLPVRFDLVYLITWIHSTHINVSVNRYRFSQRHVREDYGGLYITYPPNLPHWCIFHLSPFLSLFFDLSLGNVLSFSLSCWQMSSLTLPFLSPTTFFPPEKSLPLQICFHTPIILLNKPRTL